jgi:ribonuclease P protein component
VRWYGRLRRSSEIAFVRRRGRRLSVATLTGYGMQVAKDGERLAVTVSKDVGNAVIRNLVRRRVLGALDSLPPPAAAMRFVFVAKPAAAQESYARLAADVAEVVARLAPAR